jgi:hypothetical protein
VNVWRGIHALPAARVWPETWVRGAGLTLRAIWVAGGTLCQVTVGLVRLHCLVFGHDDGFAREPNRLFLRCGDCGRTTRGWVIASSVPRVTAPVLRRSLALTPAGRRSRP